MSVMRQVEEEYVIPLNATTTSSGFRRRSSSSVTHKHLSKAFLQDEPQHERILHLWNTRVCPTIQSLCRLYGNPHTKRAVFAAGMENVCRDFSRQTENIKMTFHSHRITQQKKKRQQFKYEYSLRVVKLSRIPERVRNGGASCVAEIPIPEIQAEYVGTLQEEEEAEAAAVVEIMDEGQALSEVVVGSHGNAANVFVPLTTEVTLIVDH